MPPVDFKLNIDVSAEERVKSDCNKMNLGDETMPQEPVEEHWPCEANKHERDPLGL